MLVWPEPWGWHFTSALMRNVKGLMYWPKYVTHFKYSVIKLKNKEQIISHLFLVPFYSPSLYTIAMRQENPSKCRMLDSLFGIHVRIWLSATLVALFRSSAAHVSILQWQKATFLPSQYRHIYTLFFKSPYLFLQCSCQETAFDTTLVSPVYQRGRW